MSRVNTERKSEKTPRVERTFRKEYPYVALPSDLFIDLMVGTGWRLRHLYWDWLLSNSCCPELVRRPRASSMCVLSAHREV